MPVLTATGVGVRHRRRWVFQGLDLTVEAGEIVAVTGPPGSGRTTVLLALAERFRLSAGTVRAEGTVALGHVPGVHEPEPGLTVAEHLRERRLLLGRRARPDDELYGLDPRRYGWELDPYRRQVLGLALARLSSPRLIAFDGFDDGLDRAERAALGELISELAAAGTAVLLTAREIDADRPWTVVRLGAEPADAEPAAPAPPPTEPAEDEPAEDEPAEDEPAEEQPAEDEPEVTRS